MRFTKDKFLIKSGGRELDKIKVEEYLNLLDEENQPIIRNIIENTEYVTFNESLKNLKSSFAMFAENIKDKEFYILIDHYKIGSQQWLVNMLEREIKDLSFKGFVMTDDLSGDSKNLADIKDLTNLVIIDDHICTGGYLTAKVYNALYKSFGKKSSEQITLHIVIGYAAKSGLKNLQELEDTFLSRTYIYYVEDVKQFSDLYGDKIYKWKRDEETAIGQIWMDDNPCLIYFDYSVGKYQSSFPSIYLDGYITAEEGSYGSLLKKKIDRTGIELFKKEIKK